MGCADEIPPTSIGRRNITYSTYTFGSRADGFGCCPLNIGLIDDAITVLLNQSTTPVIISTGTEHMQAILFRRPRDGVLCLCMKHVPAGVAVAPPSGVGNNLTGPFLMASKHIIEANNELNLGKISFQSIPSIKKFSQLTLTRLRALDCLKSTSTS